MRIRMQAWRQEQCASRRRQDIASAILSWPMTVLVGPFRSLFVELRAPVAAWYILSTLLNVFLGWSAAQQPKYWQSRRAEILTSMQLFRILLYHICIGRCAFQDVLPVAKQSHFSMLILPAMIARVTLAYQIPYSYFRYPSWLALGVASSITQRQCHQQIATENASASTYMAMLDSTMQRIQSWFPLLGIPLPTGLAATEDAMTERDVCVANNVLLQYVVGLALPAAAVFAEEEVSRQKFERVQGRGTGFCYTAVTATLLQLVLVPFQAAVALQLVLLLLKYVPT
jgi:hypothetical protein